MTPPDGPRLAAGHATAPQWATGREDGRGQATASSVGGLRALTTAVRGDLPVDVTAQVIGPSRAHVGARLGIGVPRLLVDAQHAAGGSLRRHATSVADRAPSGHLRPALIHMVPMRCRGTWGSMRLAGRAIGDPEEPP